MTHILRQSRYVLHKGLLLPEVQTSRLFYSWLMEVFNSKDVKRAKQIGPDRAAAEWIMRNGGKVKFASSVSLLTSFTSLPASGGCLVEIHAKDVLLTNSGLRHLEGLQYLKYLDLNGCKHISDLTHLQSVSESLEYLDIGRCTGLSDVTPLASMHKLRTLILTETLGGKQRSEVISSLRKHLPECDVVD